jgi:hypothetical protein
MVQQILLFMLFSAALFYLGRLGYRAFSSKSAGCASGCAKCGAVDFQKIEAQLKRDNLLKD